MTETLKFTHDFYEKIEELYIDTLEDNDDEDEPAGMENDAEDDEDELDSATVQHAITPDIPLDVKPNVQRTPQYPALTYEPRNLPDPIPQSNAMTLRIAEYFRLLSDTFHFGDVLCAIRKDGLEPCRYDLTFFLSVWFL